VKSCCFDGRPALFNAKMDVQNHRFEDLSQWEKSIGFLPMWRNYQNALDEFEQLKSEGEVLLFLKKFDGTLFYQDSELRPLFESQSIASLLDKNGKVLIGDDLYAFKDKYEFFVRGGNEDKLLQIMTSLKTDEKIQGYVFRILDQSIDSRSPSTCNSGCPDDHVWCQSENNDGDKRRRLKTDISAFKLASAASSNLFRVDFFVKWKIEAREKSGFTWRRTWMDIRRSGSFGANSSCQGFTLSETVNYAANNVADDERVWNPDPSGALFSSNACNYVLTYVRDAVTDRIDDNDNTNNTLQTTINCQ
jgi:hypothetical protein